MENNKNKKSVKFQADMLNFCDFIQVFVFTRNHHLKQIQLIPVISNTDISKYPLISRGYSESISIYCTARQCSPFRQKIMECYIIKPAQSLLMKHLVIGQR